MDGRTDFCVSVLSFGDLVLVHEVPYRLLFPVQVCECMVVFTCGCVCVCVCAGVRESVCCACVRVCVSAQPTQMKDGQTIFHSPPLISPSHLKALLLTALPPLPLSLFPLYFPCLPLQPFKSHQGKLLQDPRTTASFVAFSASPFIHSSIPLSKGINSIPYPRLCSLPVTPLSYTTRTELPRPGPHPSAVPSRIFPTRSANSDVEYGELAGILR